MSKPTQETDSVRTDSVRTDSVRSDSVRSDSVRTESSSGWTVTISHGSAGAFHQMMPDPESGPEVWVRTIPSPTLVLGSTQPDELVDHVAAEADGVEVCRRRSGGGLVWINPETDCWVDVIVPIGSRMWHDDVGKAFHWLGELWAQVLDDALDGALGRDGSQLEIQRSSQSSAAGRLWCFADLGHGELAVNDHKILGLSQRRTRGWARMQSLVLGAWPGAELNRYVDIEAVAKRDPARFPSVDDLAPQKVLAGFPTGVLRPDPTQLAERFVASLPAP